MRRGYAHLTEKGRRDWSSAPPKLPYTPGGRVGHRDKMGHAVRALGDEETNTVRAQSIKTLYVFSYGTIR